MTSDKGSDGTLVRQIQGDSYGVDISSNVPPPGSVFEVIFVVAAD